MFLISAIELRVANIVDNHVTNFFAAMVQGQEVLTECRCGEFPAAASSVRPHNPMQSSSVYQ
jgi:hypothetical protein